MAKKSNLEIYKEFQEIIDKAGSPHQSAPEFKRNYEAARLEWMKLKIKDFEVTELVRGDLRWFIRHKPFGDTKRIDTSLIGRFIVITAVHGNFSFGCNGKVTTYMLPIAPRGIDNLTIMTDPFNQPDDTEPMYLEQNDGNGQYLDILSQSVPQDVTVQYIKYPDEYGLITDKDGFTEEEELQQNEIIALAVRNYSGEIENYNRAGIANQKIQQSAI